MTATTSVETSRRSAGFGRATSTIIGAFETILLWHTASRGRRELNALDDRMLRDIGLSRADIEREYRKPFWRI